MVQLKQVDVVISGIGGFFPRSVNIEQFQQLLLENAHVQDAARWKAGQLEVCDRTSNVPDIDRFDASYFGIHRQQCTYMDPMQRLLLERTFEALLDAGLNPAEVRGKKVGVFIGSSVSENDSLMFESVENGYGITGQARTMLANRISYWLNVTGPSCSFDCSWTNGAQVLQFALEAVRTGQCDSAIVGTTNLALNIYPSWLYRSHGFTNLDGVTKPFDAEADGYSRGEAIIAIYIQRADVCKRNYATLVHANVCIDGDRSGSLTQIDNEGFTRFLRDFYDEAGVAANEVHYLEAYGSGIKQIDEIEMDSVDQVFCTNRKTPLRIGSVKSNVGHTEAADGLVALVKCVVAMETGIIPATLHHNTPNKNIPALTEGRIQVVTENTPWTGEYVAINSIGLACSFGHILLKANPKMKKPTDVHLPILKTLSTRTEDGIKDIMKTLSGDVSGDAEYTRLIHDVFSMSISGHLYRGYVLHGEQTKEEFEHCPGVKRQLWFVYSGMGSQWAGMGRELMALPIFAAAIERCHRVLLDKGVDLKHIVTTDDPKIFDNILHSFVGIAAVQIGLTDLLRAAGIVPDGIIGHSVGELGCAYADGCLDSEQMILSAYYRGKASLDCELITGMMAAVGLGAEAVKKMVPSTIDVACHNGPDSSTLSGPSEDMAEFVAQLQEKGIFAKLVNVSNIAYHSRYIRPAAPLLLKYLENVIEQPKARSSKWISTSIRETEWGSDLAKTVSSEYLTNNLLSSVYFAEGCRHIPSGAIAIEIAPHGLLQAILRRSLATGCTNIPLTKRGVDRPVDFLLQAFGKLYLTGTDVHLAPLYPPIEFPVSRGTKSLAPLVRWEHSGVWRTGLEEFKDYSFTEKHYVVTMNSEEFRDLVGHQADGRIVMPLAGYLTLVIDVLSNVKRIESAIFENVVVIRNVEISHKGSASLTVMVQRGSGDFEVSEGQNVVCYGNIIVPENFQKEIVDVTKGPSKVVERITGSEFYEELSHRGHEFGGPFENVKTVDIDENGSCARVVWKDNWPAFLTAMIKLQMLHAGEAKQSLLMPAAIRKLVVNLEKPPENGEEIEVTYCPNTGYISSALAQIAGIRFAHFPIKNKIIPVDHYCFVPSSQGEIVDLNFGLDALLGVVFQNVSARELKIIEIEDKFNPSIKKHIGDFFETRGKQVSVTELPDASNARDAHLVILPDDSIEDSYLIIKRGVKFILTRTLVKNSKLGYPLIVVGDFDFGRERFYLLKMAENVNVEVSKIPEDYLKAKDLDDNNHMWVSEYRKTVREAKAKKDVNKRIYLLSNVLPSEGLDVYMDAASRVCDEDHVRFAFVLDRSVPRLVPGEKFYDEVFLRDLKCAVYKDGQWGSYVRIMRSLSPTVLTEDEIDGAFDGKRSDPGNVTIKYVSVDPRDFSRDGSRHEYVGYSGETDGGQRVMGVAKLDVREAKLQPDSLLRWPIPHHWSLLDAATVPVNYAMAYHILVDIVQMEPSETLLIHDGCSGLGQAAIAIASNIGCVVYVTVSSPPQRAFLKENFKHLADHHILDNSDCSFEKDILTITNGEGAQVILNCFAGERLKATIRCLGIMGRIVHYRVNEFSPDDRIGLGIFLRCTCMTGMSPRKVFEMPIDYKKNMLSLLSAGLDRCQIKPVERRLFQNYNSTEILKHFEKPTSFGTAVISVNETQHTKRNKPTGITKCDHNDSYVVIGDETKSWMDATEWLVLHGAKKVTIIAKAPANVTRRLQLLEKHHCARVDLHSAPDLTAEALSQVFRQVIRSNPIRQAIITVKNNPLTAAYATDVALNVASPKKRPQLVVLHDTTDNPYRSAGGFLPVCDVTWNSARRLRDALDILDSLLTRGGEIVLLDEAIEQQQEKLISPCDFPLLLPGSIELVRNLGESLQASTKLIQLGSACPRQVREISPIFVVPGLSADHSPELRHLLRRLMYPIHCVKIGSNVDNLTNVAKNIINDIQKKQSQGTYNILGVSWGGALALEIARQLEEIGANTRLFFIDAVPDTIQSIIAVTGSTRETDVKLLSHLLKIKQTDDLKKLSDWPTMLERAIGMGNINEKERTIVATTIDHIHRQLDLIRNYKYEGKIINGPTVLFRAHPASKEESFGLTNYCKQVEIKIVTGDHLQIVKDETLIEYINDNIMF